MSRLGTIEHFDMNRFSARPRGVQVHVHSVAGIQPPLRRRDVRLAKEVENKVELLPKVFPFVVAPSGDLPGEVSPNDSTVTSVGDLLAQSHINPL